MRLKDHGNGNLEMHDVIISYPTLFTPRAVGRPGAQQGEPRFSALFILTQPTPEEQQMVNKLFMEAVQKQWPNGDYPKDQNGSPVFETSKNCFALSPKLQGELGQKYPGAVFLAANSSANRPPVVGIQGVRALPEQQSQIFGGCIVNAVVRLFCYANQGVGITAALNGVSLVDNVNVTRLDGGLDAAAALGIGTAPGLPQGAPPPVSPVPQQPAPGVPPAQQVAGGQAVAPGAPMTGVPGVDQTPTWNR